MKMNDLLILSGYQRFLEDVEAESGVVNPTEEEFLKMTDEQYDTYMCERYPYLFIKRHLSKMETCMCWGFDIGKGWYSLLDKTCQKLELLRNLTGVSPHFEQIKQKFAGARFYHGYGGSKSDPYKLCYDIADGVVSEAERESYHICEDCGEHIWGAIEFGHWVYALCPKCFKGMCGEHFPDVTDEHIGKVLLLKDKRETVSGLVYRLSMEELDEIIVKVKVKDELEKAKVVLSQWKNTDQVDLF